MTGPQVDDFTSSICEVSAVRDADVEGEIDEGKRIVAGNLLARPKLRVRHPRRSHRAHARCGDPGCGRRGRRRSARQQSLLRAIDRNSVRRPIVARLARLMLARLEYAGSPLPRIRLPFGDRLVVVPRPGDHADVNEITRPGIAPRRNEQRLGTAERDHMQPGTQHVPRLVLMDIFQVLAVNLVDDRARRLQRRGIRAEQLAPSLVQRGRARRL